jgi:hypothetical protein
VRSEAQTVVVLTVGKPFKTAQHVDGLNRKFSEAYGGGNPLVRVDDMDGKRHFLNVHEVVETYELKPRRD